MTENSKAKWYAVVAIVLLLAIAGALALLGENNVAGFPVLTAGIFSIGIFSVGIFSVGIFSFGLFALGIFVERMVVAQREKSSSQAEKTS